MLPDLDPRIVPAVFMMCLLTSAAPFAHAAGQAPQDYIVGFAHGAAAKAKGGRYQDAAVLGVNDALQFAVVHANDGAAFEARARADPDVRYVEVDRADAFHPDFVPNDPSYSTQWGLPAIGAPSAWDKTTGSTGIKVAILDTGVDHAHPDLASARLLQGVNEMTGTTDTSDSCGHGTHVTGILGASANNGAGIAGLAQVTILPVKVMDKDPTTGSCYGPFSAVAAGIQYATDQGAKVISMSLGCVGCYDQATEDAINYAIAHGVLLVASAGNNGPCTSCVSWPAADSNVMAVACTDQYNAQCSFSSSGPEVEISAPGRNIYSTVPGGGYLSMSGTSMSAPFVAGAAALGWSANGALSGAQMRSLLDASATPLGASSAFGHGLLNVPALLSSAGGAPAPYQNQPPVASFTWSASNLAVSVNAAGSSDPDGSVTAYAWNFGDGASASGVTASHTFANAGSYTVTLTVTDNATAKSSKSATVTVTAPTQYDHVGSHSTGVSSTKGGTKLTWNVPVLSSTGAGVGGATVYATLSAPTGAVTLTSSSATGGVATFTQSYKRASGTYTLCVSNVALSGWSYDASANVMTCSSITL